MKDSDIMDEPLVINTHSQLQRLRCGYKEQAAQAVFSTVVVGSILVCLIAIACLAMGFMSIKTVQGVIGASAFICTIAFSASVFQSK